MTRHKQSGIGLVETLTALSIGLGVICAALGWFAHQTLQLRELESPARAQQELINLSRWLTTQMRHAGHYGPWKPGETGAHNPFATIDLASQSVRFHRDRDNNGLHDPNDALVFALSQGRLTLRIGNNGAQEISDPATVWLTDFSPRLHHRTGPTGSCTVWLEWRLEGQAVHPTASPLRIQGTAALPNLETGSCPR